MVLIEIDDALLERLKEAAKNADRCNLCDHPKDCEVTYNHAPRITFLLCRDCWNEEKREQVGGETVVIKVKRFDVACTRCMECGLALDECGCK